MATIAAGIVSDLAVRRGGEIAPFNVAGAVSVSRVHPPAFSMETMKRLTRVHANWYLTFVLCFSL